MDTLETQLPATPTAAQLARGVLRSALETWKLDGFGEVTELLCTELVTNAVIHVGAPLTLRVARSPESIRVEVEDPGELLPELHHAGITELSGRGLLIVDALADAWGIEVSDHGKTVWFELDTRTATEEVHGVEES